MSEEGQATAFQWLGRFRETFLGVPAASEDLWRRLRHSPDPGPGPAWHRKSDSMRSKGDLSLSSWSYRSESDHSSLHPKLEWWAGGCWVNLFLFLGLWAVTCPGSITTDFLGMFWWWASCTAVIVAGTWSVSYSNAEMRKKMVCVGVGRAGRQKSSCKGAGDWLKFSWDHAFFGGGCLQWAHFIEKNCLIKIFQYSWLTIFVLVLVVQQGYSATHIYNMCVCVFVFQVIFHCRLLQGTECSFLCPAANPYSLSTIWYLSLYDFTYDILLVHQCHCKWQYFFFTVE